MSYENYVKYFLSIFLDIYITYLSHLKQKKNEQLRSIKHN